MEQDRPAPRPDRRPKSGADQSVSEDGRRRWESAIDNPDAQAFLKSALERRKRMQEEGLLHGP